MRMLASFAVRWRVYPKPLVSAAVWCYPMNAATGRPARVIRTCRVAAAA
jgi:hypothetical protein